MLKPITLTEAGRLAKVTDYAWEAARQKENPINWGDAAAFFLEGYEYARKQLAKEVEAVRKTATAIKGL